MIGIAREVADLLAPAAPKDFSFDISQSCSASVLADPNETFRILFNLMSNAVAVANRKPASLTSVTLHVMASWARAASSLCVSSKRPSSSRSCAPFSGKSGRMERTALGTARQLVPQPPSTARATSTRGRYLPLSGVRPCSWTGSRGGFDPLPGVVILELRGAQVAERGVQPAGVVDLVNEAGKIRGDVLECFVVHKVDGFDLQRLDEAFGLGVVVGGFHVGTSSRRTHALRA